MPRRTLPVVPGALEGSAARQQQARDSGKRGLLHSVSEVAGQAGYAVFQLVLRSSVAESAVLVRRVRAEVQPGRDRHARLLQHVAAELLAVVRESGTIR